MFVSVCNLLVHLSIFVTWDVIVTSSDNRDDKIKRKHVKKVCSDNMLLKSVGRHSQNLVQICEENKASFHFVFLLGHHMLERADTQHLRCKSMPKHNLGHN